MSRDERITRAIKTIYTDFLEREEKAIEKEIEFSKWLERACQSKGSVKIRCWYP